MRAIIGFSLLCLAGSAFAEVGGPCLRPAMTPVAGVLAASVPLAPELAAPGHGLGAPGGVLAQASERVMPVDAVLARARLFECMMANAAPGVGPGAYKPKTQFDNTPWRFDMNQNGRRMTADEFSAWMKAKGVRVAKGAPAAASAPAMAQESPAQGAAQPPVDAEKR